MQTIIQFALDAVYASVEYALPRVPRQTRRGGHVEKPPMGNLSMEYYK